MTTIDLQAIAQRAAMAPSIHNTQPWMFRVESDALIVSLDEQWLLDWMDRDERLALISCGAAIEFARLAVRETGHECRVTSVLTATGDDIAVVSVGGIAPTTHGEQRLIDAMQVRYTDRGPYADRPVSSQIFEDVSYLTASYGVTIHPILRRDDRLLLIMAVSNGEAAEQTEPEYHAELGHWVTSEPGPAGIPAAALPDWPEGRVSDVPLRQFRETAPTDSSGDTPPTVERDPIAVLISRHDSRDDWVATGRAFALLTLRAAAEGVTTQPLASAVDSSIGRLSLRAQLDVVGVPQFVLRLGYGGGHPATKRRSVQPV